MRIFSSFDTKFKEKIIEKEKKEIPDWNFLIISYNKYYKYVYVYLPLFFLIALFSLITTFYIYSMFYSSYSDFIIIIINIFYCLFIMVVIYLWIKILKFYIDYILDFLVITPNRIIFYNQENIFTRRWRTIKVESVKTITVHKSWLIRSIFNFGSLIILTEWDEVWNWEIDFKYIKNPDKVRQKIFKIIWNNSKTPKNEE